MTITRRRPARTAIRLLALAFLLAPAVMPLTASARPASDRRLAAAGADGTLPGADGPAPHTETLGPAAAPAPDAALAGGELGGPSIQYLDSLAHGGDQLTFTPGDRVSIGFRPRASDAWTVDGGRPTGLPAGRATGSTLAAMPNGSVWAGAEPPRHDGPATGNLAPVDGPSGPSLSASSTSYEAIPATTAESGNPQAVVTPNGLRREVFGFLPYWEVSDSSTTLDWSVLSTVAYFSVGADQYGNLLKQTSSGSVTTGWGGWTSSRMTSVLNAAHQHGTRVVLTISVFAWGSGQAATQAALLGSATARANLAKQIVAAVSERGADGVNLDFEPIVSGYADAFTAFVRTLRADLDAIHAGYQLTFDTTGYIGNYPLEAATAPGGADAIFIMGYDYRGSSTPHTGSISPLSGPPYDLTDTVAAYAARVSPSKLILGVPYYGRAWSTDSAAVHATNISGTKYGSSVTAVYDTAVGLAAQYGRLYDSVEQAPWTEYQKQTCTTTYGCVTAWRQLYYDDATSLKLRYDLVNRTALRGAGIWALGYDGTRPELYRALADKFLHDTTPPAVGISALSTTQHDAGFEVHWIGHDDSSIVSYDVQAATDGGPWTSFLTGTKAASAIYLGANGHAYAFRVRGHDSHGNVSAWGVTSTSASPSLTVGGFGIVTVDGLKLRAAAGTAPAIVATVNTGDSLALTGGPVVVDGYTWYEVTGPIHEWSPVAEVQSGLWVAVGSPSSTYVQARRPINATGVSALLHGYAVAPGGTRLVTPNGDGLTDSIKVVWTADGALDSLVLRVWRSDGVLVGTRTITATGAGAHAFYWDAKVNGVAVADATYVLQLVGTSGGATYNAPSAKPISASQLAAFGVTVDHLPVTRLSGADRYATAAAISAATFKPGVPVVYLATGLNFPDALAGAAAAGVTGGPLLLVGSTLPPATAAELARLKPARIVILGAPAVVSAAVATKAKTYTPGTVTRLSGADRYATAAAISAATFKPGVPVVYLATGLNFPDALAGAAAAGVTGGPLLLVGSTLPPATAAELARLKPARIVILGAPAVVSAAVASLAARAAGG